ncbi:Complex I intermediate-associated protein 30 domain containing protein [Seminavis robusta]|uniref:Complex I intermediate-associated protein 30 domain containing protein n=1 Tax=Seminavis robusta TaxID=568900 RepID=A0A9N8DKN6_9STRA|nr:Complex I intermediate-associated protein 30 domain containing protein [Seminavis robusta]|eukprot:Sro110_g054970.1 Complex I intermediate-associated protein 30 domain containing protein (353) ;mRNA; f:79351-80409
MASSSCRFLFWLLFAVLNLDCGRALQVGGLKFENPFQNNNNPTTDKSGQSATTLQPGDTVAVIGASGNVGKLVALRLSDTYRVHGIVRDPASVAPFFQGRDEKIKLFQCDLLQELSGSSSSSCPESLVPALKDANAIVICTGTTAFPTKAWSRSGEATVTDNVIKALLDTQFNVKDAIRSLDELGLNTPNNVDDRANALILQAWDAVCTVPQKRAIMLSSIGVQRRDSMPFPILNACGVLDAKAAGEESLKTAAAKGKYSYSIIRPGQLFGGPYDNNYYLGTLFQLDKDAATQDVQVGQGDELLGDTLRSTLAEVTAQICEGDHAKDMDFACINVKGESPALDAVQERLSAL